MWSSLTSLAKRDPEARRRDRTVLRSARERLEAGDLLRPRDVPE